MRVDDRDVDGHDEIGDDREREHDLLAHVGQEPAHEPLAYDNRRDLQGGEEDGDA